MEAWYNQRVGPVLAHQSNPNQNHREVTRTAMATTTLSEVCPVCNSAFRPKARKQRSCSRRCGSVLALQVRRSMAGIGNPNWNGGKAVLSCAQCGQGFTVIPTRGSKARFCSLPCANTYQEKHPYKRKSPSRQIGKRCKECNKPFYVYASHIERKFFCSKPCQFLWRSREFRGENSTNWYGGASNQAYPWQFKALSKKIIKRDSVKCQNPNCPRKDWRMTTHHIDYVKSNCNEGNLIALCSSCNSRANSNRPYWQALYSHLMRERGLA